MEWWQLIDFENEWQQWNYYEIISILCITLKSAQKETMIAGSEFRS